MRHFHSAAFFLLFWNVSYADYGCICNYRSQVFVYPTPSNNHLPLGVLDPNECTPLYEDSAGPWITVFYQHIRAGYILDDYSMVKKTCPGPPADTTTTQPRTSSPIVTTSQMTTTSTNSPTTVATIIHNIRQVDVHAAFFQHQCDKLAIIAEVAKDVNVKVASLTPCPNGYQDAEALILAHCSTAPLHTEWTPGEQVISHCSNMRKYSPVASFTRKKQYSGTAGVFLQCTGTPGEFYMVTQSCETTAAIVTVTPTSAMASSDFYGIGWPI